MFPSYRWIRERWVFWSFFAFFSVIAAVNAVFIYSALSTQSGLVTERAYEKGLAYNEVLAAADNQPDLREEAEYKNGVLRWTIAEADGMAITGAQVKARIIRPVREGNDFDTVLQHRGGGVYEAKISPPLPGSWTAKLECEWNGKHYRTSYPFIAR